MKGIVICCGLLLVLTFVIGLTPVEANNAPRSVITTLPFGTTVEGGFTSDDVAYLETEVAVLTNETTFLQYNFGSEESDICLYIGFNKLPTPEYYVQSACAKKGEDGDLALPHHLSSSGLWYAAVTVEQPASKDNHHDVSSTPQFIHYAVTVYNSSRTPAASCPMVHSATERVVAGAYDFNGFCWYLGGYGVSCDDVCGSMYDGHNFADIALYMIDTPSCSSGAPDQTEPISYFYLHGNPLNWVGAAGYAHVALDVTTGEGYFNGQGTNGRYYGHCTGPGRSVGSQPGTSNTHYHRALVCPCFTSNQKTQTNVQKLLKFGVPNTRTQIVKEDQLTQKTVTGQA